MDKLYNKILNEVLSIYDFDSWDDSEQTFKDDIAQNLKLFFMYKIIVGYRTNLHIFHPSWPLIEEYKDKVYCEGKKLNIIRYPTSGELSGFSSEMFNKGEYKIIIQDIEKVTNCNSMFAVTNLSKIPSGWDTSKVTTFQSMLNETYCTEIPNFDFSSAEDISYMCSYNEIISVPKFDVTNVKNMESMFSGCWKLKNVPLFEGINPVQQNMSALFYDCNKLNEKTKNIWNPDQDGTPQF